MSNLSINSVLGIVSVRSVDRSIILEIGGTGSRSSIKDGNLLDEHLDDIIKDDVFFVSSGFFGHISISSNFSGGDGIIKGHSGIEVDIPESFFVGFSTNDGNN